MKTPRVTIQLAAVAPLTTLKSDVRPVFGGSGVEVVMTMGRVIRRRLQFLLLVRREQSEDLGVIRLVQCFRLSATSRLRLGEFRDFCFLDVRQLQRLDQLQSLLKAMHDTGGIHAAR